MPNRHVAVPIGGRSPSRLGPIAQRAAVLTHTFGPRFVSPFCTRAPSDLAAFRAKSGPRTRLAGSKNSRSLLRPLPLADHRHTPAALEMLSHRGSESLPLRFSRFSAALDLGLGLVAHLARVARLDEW